MNFKTVNFGQNTGLRKEEHSKKLKFTENYFSADRVYTDGFGTPSQTIDIGTQLERGTVVNLRSREEKELRPNFGGLMSSGPAVFYEDLRVKKSDIPEENGRFYDHTFLTNNRPNAVQKDSGFRGGNDTRNDSRT